MDNVGYTNGSGLKIAFVVGAFPKLSETFILDQITGLIDQGCQVQIFADVDPSESKIHSDFNRYDLGSRTHYITAPPSNRVKRLSKAVSVIIRAIAKRPPKAIAYCFKVLCGSEKSPLRKLCWADEISKERFDIVHCHFGPNGNKAMILKKIGYPAKLVVTFHGYDVNMYPKNASKDVYKDLFELTDIFTANTNYTKSQAAALGCSPDKIEILPVGLRIDQFPFKTRVLEDQEDVRILTVGRLVEKKGYEYALRAVAKISESHANIHYVIIGDGPLKQHLEALVKELGLDSIVEFKGALERKEVVRIYQQSHIFMLPSVTAESGDKEGQGLVIQEAQAMGLPVISTLHNGIPDGLLDGESGFLVPEKDADALAEKLEHLIEHPEQWKQMGQKGRAFVEQKYQIDMLSHKLIDIYRA